MNENGKIRNLDVLSEEPIASLNRSVEAPRAGYEDAPPLAILKSHWGYFSERKSRFSVFNLEDAPMEYCARETSPSASKSRSNCHQKKWSEVFYALSQRRWLLT